MENYNLKVLKVYIKIEVIMKTETKNTFYNQWQLETAVVSRFVQIWNKCSLVEILDKNFLFINLVLSICNIPKYTYPEK